MSTISNLEALAVRCKGCECVQEPSLKCRRCGKALPYLRVEVVQPKEPPLKTIEQWEREAITAALMRFSRKDAAVKLGVGRNWLKIRIDRYELNWIPYARKQHQ